jgi:hypothetical protein
MFMPLDDEFDQLAALLGKPLSAALEEFLKALQRRQSNLDRSKR